MKKDKNNSNTKRIAILHPHASITWWAIQLMLQTAIILQDEGYIIDIYVFNQDKVNCFNDLQDELNIIDLSNSLNLSTPLFKLLFKIYLIIRLILILRKYDIIVAWNSPTHFVAWISKILFKTQKTIWFLHNIPLYYQSINKSIFTSIKRFIEKKIIINNIDYIFCPSPFIKAKIKLFYNKKWVIIPPMINKRFISTKKINKVFIKKEYTDKIILFTYGRLSKEKNIFFIIDMFKDFIKLYPNAELIIWWNWDIMHELINESKWFNVKFMWSLSIIDIIDILKKTDCFILSSMIEAFWLIIPEVSHYKIPIVTLKSDSLLSNFKTRWLYVSLSKEDMIDKLDICLQKPKQTLYKSNKAHIDMSMYYNNILMKKTILKYIKK